MARIEDLASDIYALFEGKIEHIDVPVSQEQRAEGQSLRMSNLGKPLRQLYYDLTSAPNQEAFTGKTLFKFTYGHILEHLIIKLAVQAGHDVRDQQREIEVDGIKGHIDGIIDGVLVDAKSCSQYSFDKFKSGRILDEDPFGYIYQLSGYWAAVGTDRAGFLAINKVDGELFFYELKVSTKRTLDDVRSRIALVRETVTGDQVPSRCYPSVPDGKSGNLRLGVGCSYCPHKFHCWRDANGGEGIKTYYYSTGPKFLVEVKREPKVPTEDVSLDVFPTKQEGTE